MKIFSAFLLLTAYGAAQQAKPEAGDPNNVIQVETKIVLVDAVVTDKKGNYVRDLQQKDFKVYEDNKEQTIQSFTFEADPASPQANQPRYLVLFFDNSTMNFADQVKARKAATNFIDANAGPNRQMAIVNYNGSLQIAQNFTSDAERLKSIVAGTKLATGPSPNDPLNRLAGNFGATNVILAVRELAKNLATVPGRKTLVLLSSGFKVTPDHMPDVTAAIAMCNRSNVAIYPIDMRGLVAPGAMNRVGPSPFTNVLYSPQTGIPEGTVGVTDDLPCRAIAETGRAGPDPYARSIVPRILQNSPSANQEIMHMLASGTGGFVIVDTNDMVGGLEKIGKELNEFYLIGYRPPSGGGICHLIHVKLDRSGTTVRSKTGYCNMKPKDLLAQTPLEKALENRAAASQAGNIAATMLAPYFFIGANVARVNVAIEIPSESFKFEKEKGRLRSTVDILGIAYKEDGSAGARFSDALKVDFETQKEVDAFRRRPYHYGNQLKLASGKYDLKIVISAGGENFSKLEQPLVVEAYDTKMFSVSPLALSTKLEKVGQTDQKTALLDDRTPLIASGFEVTPSGSAKFKKTGKAAMYFEIYEPALMEAEVPKLELAIQIRVFDAKGALMFASDGIPIPVPQKGGNPSIPFAGMIPVATLEPGAYKVEVVAADSAQRAFSRTANFEVQ